MDLHTSFLWILQQLFVAGVLNLILKFMTSAKFYPYILADQMILCPLTILINQLKNMQRNSL